MAEEQRLYNSVAPLRNVSALVGLVDRVQNRQHGLPGMACFHGRAGDGKSYAAIYAANRFNAVLVQVKSAWSPKRVCEAILKEAGGTVKNSHTIGHLVDDICERLAYDQTPLLIDEADFLVKRRTIEIVRDIYEGSGAPVILIGEERMPSKLCEWERIHSRMLDWVGTEPGRYEDLAHLIPIYANGIEIGDDLKREIVRRTHGSVRRICTNLVHCAEYARTRGLSKLTLDGYRAEQISTGDAPIARGAVI